VGLRVWECQGVLPLFTATAEGCEAWLLGARQGHPVCLRRDRSWLLPSQVPHGFGLLFFTVYSLFEGWVPCLQLPV
jgi:hypothetical protein